MKRKQLGDIGERLAVDHLTDAGFSVLDRNWRCPQGEVDVVAQDVSGYVFVEVKTRRGRAFGTPEDALTPRKAARLRATAQAWLAEHVGDAAVDWRIDLVAVELTPGGRLVRVEHLPYAV